MRSDAVRNREAILSAARLLVTEQGPEVGMTDIAARATVAVGTLYRHFPTKAALVAAVVEESVTALAELTERALPRLAREPAGTVLAELFTDLAERYAADRAVKQAWAILGEPAADPEQYPGATRIADGVQRLLAAARDAGAVRADICLADLELLLAGVPSGPSAGRARHRYIELALAAIRPG